ncbi:hypothetical protein L218DRAFT_834110, partial [Marasmius fiardii PR-910]
RPTIQESWQEINKRMDMLDDDLVNGYKDDIDTLLVFTGLFSAIVTAFIIESYKWLQEDPADTAATLLNTTVVLLTGLAQHNSTESLPPSINTSLPLHFTPSPSAVRINTFWFLSLTLALVDALFGLLCKQWLRAYQQQTNTRTPEQSLALRWLRFQSFEQWHVPKILASLPMMLEIALFLFFIGLLELLWNRHPVPFAIALVVIGPAVGLYLMTTMLPGLHIIQQALQLHPSLAFSATLHPQGISHLPSINLICPYRSPQSWLVFWLLSSIFRPSSCQRLLYSFLNNHLTQIITRDICGLSNWPALDLNVIQRFSEIKNCPDLYQLKGFQWLVQQTRDTPSMIPHLQNVLRELPLHLVMPAVFNEWDLPIQSSGPSLDTLDYMLKH